MLMLRRPSQALAFVCALLAVPAAASAPRSAQGTGQPPRPGGASMAGTLTFATYNFPGLMRAVYDDAWDGVPDTQTVRNYFVSLEAHFNGACGEAPVNVGEAMLSYWSKAVRPVLGNPLSQAANANMLTEFLKQAMPGASASRPERYAEADVDAQHFVREHSCQSLTGKRFRGNLQKAFVARRSLEIEPENDDRLVQFMNPALRATLKRGPSASTAALSRAEVLIQSCLKDWKAITAPQRAFENPDRLMQEGTNWCRCMGPAIDRRVASDEDFELLRASFYKHMDRFRGDACFNRR